MKRKIAIVGAGGCGREVKWLIDCINQHQPAWEFVGYFDDDLSIRPNISASLILGTIDALNTWPHPLAIAIAIGSSVVRKSIFERLQNANLSFPILIHPTSLIGNAVQIEEGVIIHANCIFTTQIQVQQFAFVHMACTVGHDTVVGSFASLMPAVNVAGEVNIASQVYIGTGAKISNRTTILHKTIIGAGAVVVSNIPSNCTAVGVPAKPVKFHHF